MRQNLENKWVWIKITNFRFREYSGPNFDRTSSKSGQILSPGPQSCQRIPGRSLPLIMLFVSCPANSNGR
jgi:hypothetical protein